MKQPWEDSLPPLSELGVGLSAGISVVWKALKIFVIYCLKATV